MEVREKKDDKIEMERRQSSANQNIQDHPPYTYSQTADKEKPTTKRNVSDPDPNPISIAPAPRSHSRAQTTSPTRNVRYRECQRNHAASSGGHVVDGCGEFMSSGEEGTAESLLCAACDCHRSFHRKEIDGMFVVQFNSFGHSQRPLVNRHVSPIMMSFGGGGGGGGRDPAVAESSTEDLNRFQQALSGDGPDQFQYHPKKRFRTKFNQEQKEKMFEFAEKIGWRMNKTEDEEVNRFCREINVKRRVFKVWMHNNKQAAKKKET
ncbi:zinc-finger homeodomain protein 6 [Raphanus sativus]|uniref:Zinc-finger homeodomain protein 6 n=1 Tax=Raphanus sativus TaxID=3726 RepID=A0A6J0LCK4_RAPSA|nr:zinc-finger homeodomain protein 6 [Raphanus sativus]